MANTNAFSLSNNDFSAITQADYVVGRFGEETYDKDSFSFIVTLNDLADPDLKHSSDQSLHSLVKDYLKIFVPSYDENHAVNQNLGSLVKRDGLISFYGSGVYYEDDQLVLVIGGNDSKAGISPLVIPLAFQKNCYSVAVEKDSIISYSWEVETYKQQNNAEKSFLFLKALDPSTEGLSLFKVWTRIIKNPKDDSGTINATKAFKALYKKNVDLSPFIDKIPTGSYVPAKANQILLPYYKAAKIKKFVFRVEGVEESTVEMPDGTSFSKLQVSVDFSLYPEVPAIAVDLDNKENKNGKVVALTDIKVIQFNPGDKANPTNLYRKYLQLISEEDPLNSVAESDRKIHRPTASNPWFIEFSGVPKNLKNTPPYNVWVDFVPKSVLALYESGKSPGFYASAEIALQVQEMKTLEVEADTAMPSEYDKEEFDPDSDF